MASFGEILENFKRAEESCVENLSPLIEDVTLRNGLVAWKSVPIKYLQPSSCEIGDEAGRWNWLWTKIEYDQSTFGSVAGVKIQDIGPLIFRLKGLRLIYPDGTINSLARDFLQAQILAKLQGKKSPGRPKAEKT